MRNFYRLTALGMIQYQYVNQGTITNLSASPAMTLPLYRLTALASCFWAVFCMTFCLVLNRPGNARAAAAEQFPIYPCIQANVKFWEDVYSLYNTKQGILHDINDLSRVYAVIDLVGWEENDSARINNERIRDAKKRISEILKDLSTGKAPETAAEQRIAALFPPQRHTTYLQAADNVRLQIGQKDRYLEGFARSGRYLPHIKQIFAAAGLPADLAYLPHVESSFNPKVYSKAGAAGLWQFTRATGQDYMTVNSLVDERLDPYLATSAAAQLLKDNYEQLNTWPLALTAYNHGRTGVLRAVNDMGSYENIFKNYDQGAFQFASRNFYSEFLAAMRVAKRYERDSRIVMERPEATMTFRLKEEVPITRLRATLGIPRDELLRLNPSLTKPVQDGQRSVPKGFLVRMPAKNQKTKQVAQKSSPSTIRKATRPETAVASQQNQRAPALSNRYTVKKGDTLYSIARTFQTTPQQVLAVNGKPRAEAIKIGESLLIPSAANTKPVAETRKKR